MFICSLIQDLFCLWKTIKHSEPSERHALIHHHRLNLLQLNCSPPRRALKTLNTHLCVNEPLISWPFSKETEMRSLIYVFMCRPSSNSRRVALQVSLVLFFCLIFVVSSLFLFSSTASNSSKYLSSPKKLKEMLTFLLTWPYSILLYCF